MTHSKRAWFGMCRLHKRTTGRFVFHYNIYGVRVFGILFTPKATAHILMDNRGFNAAQDAAYYIYFLFDACYVFVPKHGFDPACWHPFSSIHREQAQ